MQLEITEQQGAGFTAVTISHKGQKLNWETQAYGKAKVTQQPFLEINQYLAYLPEQHQDKIWQAYVDIREELSQLVDPSLMKRNLTEAILRLCALVKLESLNHWLLVYGNLYFPPEVGEVAQGRAADLEQTYLKSHYIDLAAAALSTRLLIPIWGEYIHTLRGESDAFREMKAVGLIHNSELMNSPAIAKLSYYIEVMSEAIMAKTPNLKMILDQWSPAEIPVWLRALVLVRRLTVVPISNLGVSHSIIANVFRYMESKLKPEPRRQDSLVKDKKPDTERTNEDDKTSIIENYKIKKVVAEGDVVLIGVYTKNPLRLCHEIDPTLPEAMFDICHASLERVKNNTIQPHQIRLAQWVCAGAISPRSFGFLNRLEVSRLLVCTQALLWHWGFPDLAALLFVRRNVATGGNSMLSIARRVSPRINKAYAEELNALYPHARAQRAKATEEKSVNVAVAEITNLATDIHGSTWTYVGPVELGSVSASQPGSTMGVSINIKNRITELVIAIAKKNQ